VCVHRERADLGEQDGGEGSAEAGGEGLVPLPSEEGST
jgi:hypothetical protein